MQICMCAHLYKCVFVHMHVYVHLCICTYFMYGPVNIWVHSCVNVYRHLCVDAQYLYLCIYGCASLDVYMLCVHVHLRIYVWLWTYLCLSACTLVAVCGFLPLSFSSEERRDAACVEERRDVSQVERIHDPGPCFVARWPQTVCLICQSPGSNTTHGLMSLLSDYTPGTCMK